MTTRTTVHTYSMAYCTGFMWLAIKQCTPTLNNTHTSAGPASHRLGCPDHRPVSSMQLKQRHSIEHVMLDFDYCLEELRGPVYMCPNFGLRIRSL